jgi:carbon-monoxide dehydrogenase medium subunit
MALPAFSVHQPAKVREAVELLGELREAAAVYMGGTELLLLMKLGLAGPSHLVDCKRIEELRRLEVDGDRLSIGAAVSHRQVELSPMVRDHLPALAELETRIANVRVRNIGTLCGNLCFAEPHSDPATLLIALDAEMEIASAAGLRRLPLEDFIVGPLQTALEPGELVTRVLVPLPGPRARIRSGRLAFRERPAVNLALVMSEGGIRVAVGAAGPRPVRSREAESILAERGLGGVEDAADRAAVAADPRTDLDGSVEFKAHLVRVLLRRAVEAA